MRLLLLLLLLLLLRLRLVLRKQPIHRRDFIVETLFLVRAAADPDIALDAHDAVGVEQSVGLADQGHAFGPRAFCSFIRRVSRSRRPRRRAGGLRGVGREGLRLEES